MQQPVDGFENGSEGAMPHKLGKSESLVLVTKWIKLEVTKKVLKKMVSKQGSNSFNVPRYSPVFERKIKKKKKRINYL